MSIVEKAMERLRDGPQPAVSGERKEDVVFGRVVPADPQQPMVLGKAVRDELVTSGKRIVIDQNAIRVAGLLPPPHEERLIAEQYRQIKRPLIDNATGRGGASLRNAHVIVMASALPGEGKTFMAINLAMSMARERDISVVLVDADTRKPHISKVFGVQAMPGLLDILQDDAVEPGSVILPTDIPKLSVLPAGKDSSNATELLASERMSTLMRRLGTTNRRRVVLVDSPPLLLTTESRALTAVAGQVVLVVRASHTTQQTVKDALTYLGGCSVALVLNQNTNAMPAGYYYYAGYRDVEPTRPSAEDGGPQRDTNNN